MGVGEGVDGVSGSRRGECERGVIGLTFSASVQPVALEGVDGVSAMFWGWFGLVVGGLVDWCEQSEL